MIKALGFKIQRFRGFRFRVLGFGLRDVFLFSHTPDSQLKFVWADNSITPRHVH